MDRRLEWADLRPSADHPIACTPLVNIFLDPTQTDYHTGQVPGRIQTPRQVEILLAEENTVQHADRHCVIILTFSDLETLTPKFNVIPEPNSGQDL